MWIGYPDDVREIQNPRRGLQKITDLRVNEHNTLSGTLRTTVRRNHPRRWAATFAWMPDTDADWLHDLAARTHGPGPFVVVDASTRNYLDRLQSVGSGRASLFSPTVGAVSTVDGMVSWQHDTTGQLRWVHPVWSRWPVIPAVDMSFGHDATGLPAGLEWFDATGVSLATHTDPSGIVTATPPAGARWATPYLEQTGSATLQAPSACLRYGVAVTSPWPTGAHTAAMGITAHSETVDKLPSRTVQLELVEF